MNVVKRWLTLLVLVVVAMVVVPPLLAQGDVVVPAGSPFWLVLAATLVPIVSGWLAKFLADGLKQVVSAYDAAPTIVKQVVSVLIGFGVGWVNSHLTLGTPLGADVHLWGADVIGGILTALAQAGIYRVEKNKQLALQGMPRLEQQRDYVSQKEIMPHSNR